MKKKPSVLVLAGFGLNCEQETAAAFTDAGAHARIVHLSECSERPTMLRKFDIVAFPGGFSYGDDTGSGKAFGARVRHALGDELERFLARDTLMIGICNGFQILTHAGFLPGALVRNDSERYTCRWVDVAVKGSGPWLTDGMKLSLPIAHGEGKYVAPEDALQTLLSSKTETVLQYVPGPMSERYDLPYNPNGARHDIAGVTAHNGRVLGLMPHPERAFFFTQRPDWTVAREAYREEKKRMPVRGDGAQLFTNAVTYFTS